MTKQKHIKAVDAASNAEELLPLEQMMVQGGAPNEGAAYAVDDANQDKDSEHHGTESKGASLVPKLRFAGFTESWRSVYLKDVVTSFEYGLNAPAKDYDFFTKYLRITDIDEDSRKFLITDLKSPDIEAAKASDYLAQDGDLFFARTASVGRTYLYSRSDGRVVFAGYLIRGHVRQDLFSPVFIFYSTLTTQYEMFVAATSARSVQPGINAAEYGSYQFAVPSISEQQRIGALFKELDHNIELNRGLLEKLTQLKKSMLEQMFPREGESVPRLRFAGFTEPWTVCKLGDLGQAISGIAFPESAQGGVEGMPFFKVSDMNLEGNESVMHYANNYVSYELVAKSKWKPIEGPAVIFVRDGAAVLLNRKRLILSKCLMDHHIMHYCLDESVWNPFFALAIFEGIDLTALVRTSVTPSYGAAEVEAIVVKVPNLAEQQRIGAFFKALDQRIAQQRAKLEKLGQLKKALLEQMFV